MKNKESQLINKTSTFAARRQTSGRKEGKKEIKPIKWTFQYSPGFHMAPTLKKKICQESFSSRKFFVSFIRGWQRRRRRWAFKTS